MFTVTVASSSWAPSVTLPKTADTAINESTIRFFIFHSGIVVGTNIRTLVLTFIVMNAVHVQSQPSADPTGVTSLIAAENSNWPAIIGDSTTVGLLVDVAPYGHAQLSKSSLSLFLPQIRSSAQASGRVAAEWSDIKASISHALSITPQFQCGLQLSGGFQGAPGFASTVWGALDIQVSAQLLDVVALTAVIQDIAGTKSLASVGTLSKRAFFIGIGWTEYFPMSATISLQPENVFSVGLQSVFPLYKGILSRLAVSTQPLSGSVALLISDSSIPSMMVQFELVGTLGIRTTLGIQL